MSDPIDELVDEQAERVSADPAPSAPIDTSIEAVMKRFTESLDDRFSGFQSSIDRKINPLSKELAALRAATLTPEERDEQDKETEAKEVESLRMENQLYRLRGDHADAVDLIIGAMGTQTLEEQIAFIESRMGKKAIAQVEAAVEAADEAEASGEVDTNNPGSRPRMGAASAAFGDIDSDEAADAVLAGAGKGTLARLRALGR